MLIQFWLSGGSVLIWEGQASRGKLTKSGISWVRSKRFNKNVDNIRHLGRGFAVINRYILHTKDREMGCKGAIG